jgi:hypothetical protein
VKLTTIKNAITSRAGRQILLGKKYSPQVLFAVGAVGFVGTVVLAARATLKLDEILEQHEKTNNDITNLHAKVNGDAYSDEDARKDRITLVVKTSLSIAKLYAPALVAGSVSIAALTGSHFILNSRNAALSAAYAALDKGYRHYRDRVVAELGVEKDRDFATELDYTEVEEVKADGKIKKTNVATGVKGLSPYSVIFDEGNKNWQRPDHYNSMFLRSQQNWANDLLNARGHVLLNDVYDMLGFPRTKAGCVVGWVKNPDRGDGYISFGVFEGDVFMGKNFVQGDERSIILDFNVDGPVYDLI